MEVKIEEYFLHAADLLHALFVITAIAGYKVDQRHGKTPVLTLGAALLWAISSVIVAAKVFNPNAKEAGRVYDVVDHFLDMRKEMDITNSGSYFSLVGHVMTASEVGYNMVVSLLSLAISGGIVLQILYTQRLNVAKGFPRSSIFSLFVVLGCVYSVFETSPNAFLDMYPVRFGPFHILFVCELMMSYNKKESIDTFGPFDFACSFQLTALSLVVAMQYFMSNIPEELSIENIFIVSPMFGFASFSAIAPWWKSGMGYALGFFTINAIFVGILCQVYLFLNGDASFPLSDNSMFARIKPGLLAYQKHVLRAIAREKKVMTIFRLLNMLIFSVLILAAFLGNIFSAIAVFSSMQLIFYLHPRIANLNLGGFNLFQTASS